jgi:hypothetical protein
MWQRRVKRQETPEKIAQGFINVPTDNAKRAPKAVQGFKNAPEKSVRRGRESGKNPPREDLPDDWPEKRTEYNSKVFGLKGRYNSVLLPAHMVP